MCIRDRPSLRCFLPRCFFSPYKFPIQKTGALEAYGRITNRWPGGSARPPDTRRASVFALQDTVRVSGGRALPPDHRFVSLQSAAICMADLYGEKKHRGRKHRSEGSRHRLTPYEGSNSTRFPPSWRGTARPRAISNSWRVVDRFPWLPPRFERCRTVRQRSGHIFLQ